MKLKTAPNLFTVETVGEITNNILAEKLGIKSNEITVTNKAIEHIEDEHPLIWERYKNNVVEITNDPDYVFEGNKGHRLQFIKKIDKHISLVLDIDAKPDNRNHIITMFEIGDTTVSIWKEKRKIVYKRE
jgi:hypothetical protein